MNTQTTPILKHAIKRINYHTGRNSCYTNRISFLSAKPRKTQSYHHHIQQLWCFPCSTLDIRRFYASSVNDNKPTSPVASEDSTRITPLSDLSTDDETLVLNEVSKEDDQTANDDAKNVENSSYNSLDDIPGTKTGKKILAMVYTCTKCNTRSAKKFTEQAYTQGVVLIRCPNCQSLHLIADNLGMFGDSNWNIEKYLKEHGENVTVVNEDDVLEFTKNL